VELAESYVEDAEEFLRSGRAEDALVASSYAEGLLTGYLLALNVNVDCIPLKKRYLKGGNRDRPST